MPLSELSSLHHSQLDELDYLGLERLTRVEGSRSCRQPAKPWRKASNEFNSFLVQLSRVYGLVY